MEKSIMKKTKQKIRTFIERVIYICQMVQNTQLEQVAIKNQYLLMKKMLLPKEMPSLDDVGFRVYSQFEEDGILLYIFSLIGTTNKKVVEICAGDEIQCMAANLIINHGWEGLLFDGNKDQIDRGNSFYARNKDTFILPPILKHAWLTQENINELIEESGFKGEIDLLSMDIDGNDYYIMKAINVIKPRVIICETHNVIPDDLALTIPYSSDFCCHNNKYPEDFRSVSLLAMTKLLNDKGYRLIGAHRHGFNAIFVLNQLGEEYFPEVSIKRVHDNTYTKLRKKTAWNKIKDLPWIKV